jgi:hypothetical protein
MGKAFQESGRGNQLKSPCHFLVKTDFLFKADSVQNGQFMMRLGL